MRLATLTPADTSTWKCKGCGCVDDRACLDENGAPCYWIMRNWCSSCDERAENA